MVKSFDDYIMKTAEEQARRYTRQEIVDALHKEILEEWDDTTRNEFYIAPWQDNGFTSFHFSLGRYVRNKFNMWAVASSGDYVPEIVNGTDVSPNHPDNLSMSIIKEVWERGR